CFLAVGKPFMPRAASLRLGLSRDWTPALSCATPTGSNSLTSIARRAEIGRQAPFQRRGAADCAKVFRSRGRADSRRGPDGRTMVRHLEVNWGQGAYRPAHPPVAPSAAVRDRPALCSL